MRHQFYDKPLAVKSVLLTEKSSDYEHDKNWQSQQFE